MHARENCLETWSSGGEYRGGERGGKGEGGEGGGQTETSTKIFEGSQERRRYFFR